MQSRQMGVWSNTCFTWLRLPPVAVAHRIKAATGAFL
jgi:hypothetical protein